MSAGAGDSDIEKLARALWGEPNRQKSTRDDIRYGTNGSKSVRPKDRTWYDHESNEGGGFVDLYQKAYGEVPSPNASGETAYDYRSPDGALLYQVVRRIPKDFRQRRPDGNGGWVWKMAGVVRVPYRLPELMGADPAVPVFICEGEKDCDALAARGFVTTTNPGGAGKWLPNMSAYLRGRDAIILPDNDQAGDDHALDVAAKLHGIARTVTIHRLSGLPAKGDVSDWLAAGGNSDDLLKITIQEPSEPPPPVADEPPPPSSEDDYGSENVVPFKRVRPEKAQIDSAIATPLSALDLNNIPPRRWIYGRELVRGYVSVLASPGGTGKTAYTMAVGVSIASATALLKPRGSNTTPIHCAVHKSGPVWFFNLEDPMDELRRRIKATLQHHTIRPEDVGDQIYIDSGRDKPLVIAKRNPGGGLVVSPIVEPLVQEIIDRGITVLIVDPFVQSHEGEENRNEEMNFVMSLWGQVAHRGNCAVWLVHHFRKGGKGGDGESFRGAVSIQGAARSMFTVGTMTAEEAGKLGIEETDRWQYIRHDNAKSNMAPAAGTADWYRLVGVKINNGDDEYPDGDHVQAVEAWSPPSPWDGLPWTMIERILVKIDEGPGDGEFYALGKQSKDRWAGCVIIEDAAKTDGQAAAVLKAWKESGLVEEGQYSSPKLKGRMTGCVRVNQAKLSEMRQAFSTRDFYDE